MFIFGFLTLMYGVFAVLCTRYRFFPTPPPSGIPLYFHHGSSEIRMADLAKGLDSEERGEKGVTMREKEEFHEEPL